MSDNTPIPRTLVAHPSLEWRRLAPDQTIVTVDGLAHLSLTDAEFEFLTGLGSSCESEDSSPLDRVNADDLVGDLARAGLLVGSSAPAHPKLTMTKSGLEFSGFRRFVQAVHSLGGHLLLGRTGIVAAAIVILVGLGLIDRPAQEAAHFPGPVVILAISISGLIASIFHETAHALVIHHHGRRVGPAGMGWYWGALSFYVDATDAMLMPRRARLWQGLAGPIADALFAAILTIAAAVLSDANPWSQLLLQIAILLWLDVLLNLCPILELDGYWLVSDLLGRPQLRAESKDAFRRLLHRQASPGDSQLAVYFAVSSLVGLALIGASLRVWFAVYSDLIIRTWSASLIGKAAVFVWLAPVALGLIAPVLGRLGSSRKHREVDHAEGGESHGNPSQASVSSS